MKGNILGGVRMFIFLASIVSIESVTGIHKGSKEFPTHMWVNQRLKVASPVGTTHLPLPPAFQPDQDDEIKPVRLTQDKKYTVVGDPRSEDASKLFYEDIFHIGTDPASSPFTIRNPHKFNTSSRRQRDDDGSNSSEDAEEEEVQGILEGFIRGKDSYSDNLNILTQAFRFVKLDTYLGALDGRLSRLQQSYELMQENMIKQELEFSTLMKGVAEIGNKLLVEASHVRGHQDRIERKLESLHEKVEKAVEKMIESSSTSTILMDFSKESVEHVENVAEISKEVLKELRSVKTELGDVGQASIQTVYSVHKSEENLMSAMGRLENRTIYALRQQLSTESSGLSHLGGDGRIGNSFQADSPPYPHTPSLSSPGRGELSANGKSSPNSIGCLSRKILINDRPRDCSEIQLIHRESKDGVYTIYPLPETEKPIKVFCDFESKGGGGWTLLQRREGEKGARDTFGRTWKEYEIGFGSPLNSYWLGLSVMAALTSAGDQELGIELRDWDENVRFANYGYFRIGNSSEQYRIHVADYSGTAGDALSYHNGMMFSTKDRDNDLDRNTNCAQRHQGGWWFKNCLQSNLNGLSSEGKIGQDAYGTGITWASWHGYYQSLKSVHMKIRPRKVT